MSIQGISSTAMMLLSPMSAIERIRSTEPQLLHALENLKPGSESGDKASVRFANLDYAHTRLRESNSGLQSWQARKTVAETAYKAVCEIQSELEEIQGLIGEISEGDFSESQLADAQLIIESRVARINDIAAAARYGGESILTGETVRVTTDAVTGEGFDIRYDAVDSETLGLSAIDLVGTDVETNVEIISDAIGMVENIEADVAVGIGEVEAVLEERVGEVRTAFESLMGAEMLNAGDETRWLSTGEGVGDVLSGLKLSREMVVRLLVG
jgi:hypothetical protein